MSDDNYLQPKYCHLATAKELLEIVIVGRTGQDDRLVQYIEPFDTFGEGEVMIHVTETENIFERGRGDINMHHHRHIDFIGDLTGDLQRHKTGIAGGVEADPHFNASQRVPVGTRHFDRIEGCHQA